MPPTTAETETYLASENRQLLLSLSVDERCERAVKAFKQGSFKGKKLPCARHYIVPYGMFRSRLEGSRPKSENGGNRTKLTEAEDLALRAWINLHLSAGYPLTLKAVRDTANAILRDFDSPEPMANVQWASRYMARNNDEFAARKAKAKAWVRKVAQSREDVIAMFDVYKETVEKNHIFPDNEWNSDEAGYRVGVVDGSTYLFTYTEITEVEALNPEVRTLVTVIEGISASGRYIPPFVIMPGTEIKVKHLANTLEDEAVLATSPNGYTDDQLSLAWFDHWEQHSRPLDKTEKRLLVLDNHGSHCTWEFFHRSQAANVVIFLLPPHSTHFIQPLDVGIFSICKLFHQRDILKRVEYGHVDYTKLDFLDSLRAIRNKAMKKSNIISAWRKAGLHPIDPDAVVPRLRDPLTSAADTSIFQRKRGFIADPNGQNEGWEERELIEIRTIFKETEERLVEQGLQAEISGRYQTPPPPEAPYKGDSWKTAKTPELKVGTIRHYNNFVASALKASIDNKTPLTPTACRVHEKTQKALFAMGWMASESAGAVRAHRKRNLEDTRAKYKAASGNRLAARLGPIVVDDARLRAANDEHGRKAAREKEMTRLLEKDREQERRALNRWIAGHRKSQKAWMVRERARLKAAGIKRTKQTKVLRPHQENLQDLQWLVLQYRGIRKARWKEYQEKKFLAKQAIAQEQGLTCPLDQITLPLDWHPPGPQPQPWTPWVYNKYTEGLAEEAIANLLGGKVAVDDNDEPEPEPEPEPEAVDSDAEPAPEPAPVDSE